MDTIIKRILSTVLTLYCLYGTQVLATVNNELIFGVHPFKKPEKIYTMFRPLVRSLSSELGLKISIRIGKSYEEILNLHKNGKVDFGYFGPASYVRAHRESGVVPIARVLMNGRGAFKGVIVIRSNSNISKLKELRGKSFAFGDTQSTLSHYIPHYLLMQEGIYLKQLSHYAFTGNHENVALNVLSGRFDAGGLKPAVAQEYLDKGLKILVESDWIPEHLFAARQSLDINMRQHLTKALLKTDINVLRAIKPAITGLEPADNKDYNMLRQIISEVDTQDPVKLDMIAP